MSGDAGRYIMGALQIVVGVVLLYTPFAAAGPYFIASGVLTIVGSVIAGALAGSTSDGPSLLQQAGGKGHLGNSRSTQEPVGLIYGRVRVGLNYAYMGSSGSENNFLHIAGIIGEGEMNRIALTGGVPQVFLDDKLYTLFGGLVYFEFFGGSADQDVCSTLQTAIPAWEDPMRNTAYIYLRIQFSEDYFQAYPNITVEVEGLKVLDPRTGEIAWSDNPALAAYDIMTRSPRRGGMGIAPARIDVDSVIDAANYCETKGWTVNVPLKDNRSVIDNLEIVLSCFRGAVINADNKFKIRYRDLNYETPVMTLDEEDIIDVGPSTLEISKPSIQNTPNAIRCKYLSIEKHYVLDDYVLADDAAAIADGDYREESVNLYGVVDLANLQKLASFHLESSRINKQVSLACGMRALNLEPFDVVQLSHAFPAWENKLFRVQQVTFDPNGHVGLSLIEEDSIFYDDIYNLATHNWHDTLLPDPSGRVPSVRSVTNREETYYYRNRTFTRWIVSFEAPPATVYPWWDYAEIWIRIGEDGEWKYMTRSRGDYQLDPVEEGVTYYCRLVSVSIFGTRESFNSAYTTSKRIVGKTTRPSDLTGITAVASGDTVSIFGDPVSDPDIEGYEVRLGNTWTAGIFIAFSKHPFVRLVGVRPGIHTFWMAARDNAGNYSMNPKKATCTVFYPSGYTDKNTWAWDFTAGTFDKAMHDLYAETDILRLTHAAETLLTSWEAGIAWEQNQISCDGFSWNGTGWALEGISWGAGASPSLKGSWLSPVYDLGSKKTVRVWGDFLTIFMSSSGIWDQVIPLPRTWADLGLGSRTWAEIFGTDGAAARLKGRIYWGDAADSLPNYADYFEILAPEFEARCVQVRIEIEDPSPDVFLYLQELNMKAAYWQ